MFFLNPRELYSFIEVLMIWTAVDSIIITDVLYFNFHNFIFRIVRPTAILENSL